VSKSLLNKTITEKTLEKDSPETPITAANSQISVRKFIDIDNSTGFFYRKGAQRKSIFCMRVRKTETVMTDRASEVENSILIDNYEGLMAKIQENRLF
jgi:hypothetical protein